MPQKLAAKIAAEINSTIVQHPRFQKAFDGILNIISMATMVDLPFGATVTAPSGCGKTALVKSIEQSIPSTKLLPDGTASLSVSAEANATIGDLVAKLLRKLGYPTTIRTSLIREQSALLSEALRERGVKVIFIDESQHIIRGKRTLSAAAITDWVKRLSDEAGVVTVRHLKYCFVHRTKLHSHCQYCNNPLAAYRSLLGGAKSPPPVRVLSQCLFCREELRSSDLRLIDQSSELEISTNIAFQKAIISAVVHGYFYIEPFSEKYTLEQMMVLLKKVGLEPRDSKTSEILKKFDQDDRELLRGILDAGLRGAHWLAPGHKRRRTLARDTFKVWLSKIYTESADDT